MEDWDIPVEDDFESRYADELEMLDDFEGKCLLTAMLSSCCSDGCQIRVQS